jgi:integral membrane protein|tara:strand:+ start:307 stop:579 length:273 start_codon:yes stop_codon:yes gene_type:complete
MKTTFRITAFLEGLSYILLLFVAVPIKYNMADATYVQMLGMPHGLLFMAYLFLAIYLRPQYNWDNKTFLLVLAASVIPFGTFYVDRKVLR